MVKYFEVDVGENSEAKVNKISQKYHEIFGQEHGVQRLAYRILLYNP